MDTFDTKDHLQDLRIFYAKNAWAEKQFADDKNAWHVWEINKGGVYLKVHVRILSIYLNRGHMEPTSGKPINWGHNNASVEIKMCTCSRIKLDEMDKNEQKWGHNNWIKCNFCL